MKVVRRKIDFCSIFAKNIHGGYTLEQGVSIETPWLELILRVHRLYVSSNNKKVHTCTTRFAIQHRV